MKRRLCDVKLQKKAPNHILSHQYAIGQPLKRIYFCVVNFKERNYEKDDDSDYSSYWQLVFISRHHTIQQQRNKTGRSYGK
jgi:hypothetical protein